MKLVVRVKQLKLLLLKFEKQFGKGSIMKLEVREKIDVEVISTGASSLDLALGIGVPKGRIIEIYDLNSSGKTTLAIHILTEAQRKGEAVAFIDADMLLILHMLKILV